MIPKTIHYCWFGGKPLPELAQKCIASWKKYCPDYEIVRWDETNFDLDCCDYVREAYAAKMWAFVSDYARFKILYEHGGVYFDTDVELLKPIDDILACGPFMGFEVSNGSSAVAPGLGIAAEPGMTLYKEILDDYHASHFGCNESGRFFTVVKRVTRILENHGRLADQEVNRVDDINIYPPEYFCPLNYYTGELRITENTRSIHHYTASWLNQEEKKIQEIKQKAAGHEVLARCVILPLFVANKINRLGVFGTVRFAINKLKTLCGGGVSSSSFICIFDLSIGGAV